MRNKEEKTDEGYWCSQHLPSLPTSPHYHSFRFLSPTHQLCLAEFHFLYLVLDQETLHTEKSAACGCMTASGLHPLPLVEWPRQVTSQIAYEDWKGLKMEFYLLEILVSPNLIHLHHGDNSLFLFFLLSHALFLPLFLPLLSLSLSFSLPPFHPLNCNITPCLLLYPASLLLFPTLIH